MSLITKREIRVIRNLGSSNEDSCTLRGNVVGARAYFPIGSDVQQGDVIETPGATPERRGVVRTITVFDSGSPAVNHLEATLAQ